MTTASYATLAAFQMDASRFEQQRGFLKTVLAPGVRAFPGVVDGHWTLDRSNAESHVLITFTSLEAAERFRNDVQANATNQAANGVALTGIRLLEVLESV